MNGLMTQKLEETSHKHCDSACMAKRRRIDAQMKALQKQINSDYHSMISFGNKAGYVPPVKSIRQQVMDGSLLGGSDDATAPPSFDPTVHASSLSTDSSDQDDSDDSAESHHHAHSHSRSLDLPKPSRHHAHENDDIEEHIEKPHLSHRVRFHENHHAASHEEARSHWNKLFSFMKQGPHDESHQHVKAPRKTIPNAVRRAIQRALSFATTPHKSRTEKAGDRLLGLAHAKSAASHGHSKAEDPLDDKFLKSYFGDRR